MKRIWTCFTNFLWNTEQKTSFSKKTRAIFQHPIFLLIFVRGKILDLGESFWRSFSFEWKLIDLRRRDEYLMEFWFLFNFWLQKVDLWQILIGKDANLTYFFIEIWISKGNLNIFPFGPPNISNYKNLLSENFFKNFQEQLKDWKLSTSANFSPFP